MKVVKLTVDERNQWMPLRNSIKELEAERIALERRYMKLSAARTELKKQHCKKYEADSMEVTDDCEYAVIFEKQK